MRRLGLLLPLIALPVWAQEGDLVGTGEVSFPIPCGGVPEEMQRNYEKKTVVASTAYTRSSVGVVSDAEDFNLISCAADFKDLGISIGSAIPNLSDIFGSMVDRLQSEACDALSYVTNQLRDEAMLQYSAPFDLFEGGVATGGRDERLQQSHIDSNAGIEALGNRAATGVARRVADPVRDAARSVDLDTRSINNQSNQIERGVSGDVDGLISR